jgi:formylglycine-generating enzyme required for sulfatase activity
MVPIAGGTLLMGSATGDADERPQREVRVESFELDVTEVTAGQFDECVNAGGCERGETTVSWEGAPPAIVREQSPFCTAGRADRTDHPMICVSWDQAAGYCAWAGKRLPTEAEWEWAARGADGRAFPWGDAPDRSRLCHGRWSTKPAARKGTCPVGSFPGGATAAGVHDLAGSVWEWTSSPYCPYPQATCASAERVFRGGGWYIDVVITTTDRGRAVPGERLVEVGFRCAR